MALGDRAEAYDFSLFEDHGHASAAVRKPQQEAAVQPKGKILAFPDAHPVHRNKGKVLRAVTRVLFAAVIFGFVMNLIHSQAVLTELTEEVSEAQTALTEQQSIETQIQAQQAEKYSLPAVREAAEDLGMRKVSQSQIQYFSVSDQDQGTVLQAEEEKDWLTLFLESIWSWLS